MLLGIPPLVWLLILLLILGVWVGSRLLARLETAHTDTWINLGRPSFFSSSIADRIRFQVFVYFGKKYKDINDPNITKLIWASRAILVLIIALVIYGNTTGILPFRS